MSNPQYVLVTPAKNESAYLPGVIESVIAQSVLPEKWVIVNDNSDDDTGDIIESYAKQYSFISPIHITKPQERSFGAKARAFGAGYALVCNTGFDFIGNLDADVSFGKSYYAEVMKRMEQNPKIGTGGGVIWDKRGAGYRRTISNCIHTPGAVLFLKRQCFDDVGGYPLVTCGGEDSIVVLTARMKGWLTTSYQDLPVYHHKAAGSSAGSACRKSYNEGMTEYHIGTHPVFAVAKAVRRFREAPVFVSSLVRLYAYFRLYCIKQRRDADTELVTYVQREQMRRLFRRG